ncbi:MAG: homoserine dehydrogenase [Ruminococcaceae bacterium]|nr:homoserine dehydrogenase [Oscillospiraceae bacterium]
MVNIAILGHGVVGSGVAEVLQNNCKGIAAKAGDSIVVRRILDLRAFPDLPYADLFTTDFQDILQDEEIRIVVETMGGLHPAYDFVKACLLAGKSVVTSNKELVAAKGDELLTIARERNLNFLFEASVGGGIPILRPLDQCLAANEVFEVAGILNGTTNFMLTKMIREKMSFDGALALAQKLGYAERNPAADVEGMDACRKTCILASLAFGKHVYPEEVYTEGITAITEADVQYAAACGGVIKLLGRAIRTEDGHVFCMVAPMILPSDNLLAGVDDVFNGIMVRGDSVGDVVFVGRGAGKLPTASAVVADVIDEVKHLNARKYLYWGPNEPGHVRDHRLAPVSMLMRFSCEEDAGALVQIGRTFGDVRMISIPDAPANEVAFITPCMPEYLLMDKIGGFSGMTLTRAIRMYAVR